VKKIKVAHIITRAVMGGAQKIVLELLKRTDCSKFETFVISGVEGTLFDGVERHILVPELVRGIKASLDIKTLLKISLILNKLKPDIVHCHTYKAGVIGCISAKIIGIKNIIFTPHGHIFEKGANIPGVPANAITLCGLYWLTRVAEMCARKITAVSQTDMASQVNLYLAPKHKYCVIHNGIDIDAFGSPNQNEIQNLITKFGLGNFHPIIGAIGRLTAEKGHKYLISAMPHIKKEYPNVLLLIIGEGELKYELKKLVQKLHLEENVKFLGEVADVSVVLAIVNIFVQPSLYESQGIAMIEAMASKKPIVATRVGGTGDVVGENETGILVPPANSLALAAAIINLLKDKKRADKYGMTGYERAKELFSVKKMIKNYENLYLTLARTY